MAARAPDGSNCSYEVMKARHKEAYGYLTRALQIDEAGEGDRAEAIDMYSKGITELEKAVAMSVHTTGEEEKKKVEDMRKAMLKNIEMSRERVGILRESNHTLQGTHVQQHKWKEGLWWAQGEGEE
jgi:spastin